jgi:hypothetical protein
MILLPHLSIAVSSLFVAGLLHLFSLFKVGEQQQLMQN